MKSRFDPANLFLLLILLNVLLHFLLPLKQIIFYPYNYLGIFLFVIGWIPNIWLGIYFRKKHTAVITFHKPRKLITSGLFRISRNPIYLGMTIALFGEAIFLGSLITFILPSVFFILISKINIPIEERNLNKKFGKKYLEYKKQVRRWI